MFPLRPYLSLLVEALEDGDSTVREVARSSVVELFTGPGVTDAARSDLKKELTKKGVRKGIIDDVLAKVLGGRSTGSEMGSENGDVPAAAPAKKEYVPPSLALQQRRNTASSSTSTTEKPGGASGGVARSVSQGTGLSRPPSRSAALTSPTPPTPVGEGNSDVQPVYVSIIIRLLRYLCLTWFCQIASSRDLENEIDKHFGSAFEVNVFLIMSFYRSHHFQRARRPNTTGRPEIKLLFEYEGCSRVKSTCTFERRFLSHLKQIVEASIKTVSAVL